MARFDVGIRLPTNRLLVAALAAFLVISVLGLLTWLSVATAHGPEDEIVASVGAPGASNAVEVTVQGHLHLSGAQTGDYRILWTFNGDETQVGSGSVPPASLSPVTFKHRFDRIQTPAGYTGSVCLDVLRILVRTWQRTACDDVVTVPALSN